MKKSVYFIERKTKDFFHSVILDFEENEFKEKFVAPLEIYCSSTPNLPQHLILEAVYHIIYFYFVFDHFEQVKEIIDKFHFLNQQLEIEKGDHRILINQAKLNSMIRISVNSKENQCSIIPEKEHENENNDTFENQINREILEFYKNEEIFSIENNQEYLKESQLIIPNNERVKTANYLLLYGYIDEDFEMMKRSNEEYEYLIKENGDKNDENHILCDSYLGVLILNFFKSKASSLKISDLLESFSLVIELHGIPHSEKVILLFHSCEKFICNYQFKQNKNDEKNIEIENNIEKKNKYKEILEGFKKNMQTIILKLKNVETNFTFKFLLEIFKEYIKPNETNEKHSDLIISIAICYLVLEIKVAILEKKNENKNDLKIFLLSFWNFLKILKNNKKYEIIKTFLVCSSTFETISFLKAILFYIILCFKHFYQNLADIEIKEADNVFSFNPNTSISFEENNEFKIINSLLKGEKNKLKFDDYEEDKQIIFHYLKFLFQREKEIEKRALADSEITEKNKIEMQLFAKNKKKLIEKIKIHYLFFDYKKSLK